MKQEKLWKLQCNCCFKFRIKEVFKLG